MLVGTDLSWVRRGERVAVLLGLLDREDATEGCWRPLGVRDLDAARKPGARTPRPRPRVRVGACTVGAEEADAVEASVVEADGSGTGGAANDTRDDDGAQAQ